MIVRHYIDFEPVGRRGGCPAGMSLLECARHLGVDLVNLCGGVGGCGRCRVQVLSGEVSDVTPKERALLTSEALAKGYRLACCTIPVGDCKVGVPPESLTAPQRTQVEGLESAVAPEPCLHAYPVQVSPPSLERGDLRADAERLCDALAQQHQVPHCILPLRSLRGLPAHLRREQWQTNVVVRDADDRREIVALLSPSQRPLGLAVDLGTTKIAAYLVDLGSGRTLAARGEMNPQIAYGEDLIARMGYAKQSPAAAARLQQSVVDVLNDIVEALCTEVGASSESLVEAVVVGNTAMHHLFLRLPVDQLARAPYVPTIKSALDIKACDVGLHLVPEAYVHLLPNIAGFVGADHVAMLLATEVARAKNVVLALDIGTNTEICLANQGMLTSLSCASGPAFEGAHIKHGMRAAQGAIERLRIEGDRVMVQTIGGASPVGLCGSGILDSLAELHRMGIIDARGKLGEHPRIRRNPNNGAREFVLVSEAERDGQPAITFTQQDVQALQLAKGAVRAGIQVLLESQGLDVSDLDQVIIAGAFGTYIDVTSAMAVGMLPVLPEDRFAQVGNAAGIGAKLALVSRGKRSEAQDIARRVGYIELATAPRFRRAFARAMFLGSIKA